MNKEMELIVQRMDDEIVGNLSNLDEAWNHGPTSK